MNDSSLHCPVCKTHNLNAVELDSKLSAFACLACGGNWLNSTQYLEWLDQQVANLPEKPADGAPLTVSDQQQAKLCPECKRIMLRYRVGHGLGFSVDQCAACNGVWLDSHEWEVLKRRNLHDDINAIFTAPWQNETRQEEARARLDAIYAKQFKEDYEEIKRIRRWLDGHPDRERIINFLNDADPFKA
jgi:Zn-finger nucleic acid-binding protein